MESTTTNDFTDRTMVCRTCDAEFVFEAKDQAFYAENNFTDPKDCKACRAEKKAKRNQNNYNNYSNYNN